MSTDLCIVSMMKLLKFWFYLLSGTTRSSKSVNKYYTVALIYLVDSDLYVNHLRHLEQVILCIVLIINYLITGFLIPFQDYPNRKI